MGGGTASKPQLAREVGVRLPFRGRFPIISDFSMASYRV
jgi:hypothetical protein